MKVRTRYAPSPTGYFHVGGARTALYNYLFAKHHNGEFIVRIEDTDSDRNVADGVESQLSNINWLSITPDESPLKPGNYGPYKQTEKLARYEQLARTLLNNQSAYLCFCSKEQLDGDRDYAETNHLTPKYNRRCLNLSKAEIDAKLSANIPYTIRLKINENKDYAWDDVIRGPISIPGSSLTDPVILKSNRIAMYNMAVVVDDYDMCITHVLRGEEHISNTPYQIAIKEALGFDTKEILYGHLSVIVNEQGKKLSKRDTSLKQFIGDYRELGYLPESIDNFLSLLGWAPSDNKEVMTLQNMISKFDLKTVSTAPSKFDIIKMNWIAAQHIKLLNNEQYLNFVKPFISSQNKLYKNHEDEILLLLKPQVGYAKELNVLIDDLFSVSDKLDENALKDITDCKNNYTSIVPVLISEINSNSYSNEADFKQLINKIIEVTGLTGKNLFMTIRVACTRKTHGPELAKTLYLLGVDVIKQNLLLAAKEL